jgi:hypothetical protein
MKRRTFLAAGCLGTLATATARASQRNIMEGYQAGINLGSWISQYNRKASEFETRIAEKDIAQIASWGMDHVRLPIDYDFFTSEGVFREDRLAFPDKTIKWAKNHGLNVILDLHHAPGYSFTTVGKNELFDDEELQWEFFSIWTHFAERYKVEGDNLMFEILNEVVEATPAQWNRLAGEAISTVRNIDPRRWIVIGGTQYNSIRTLKDIAIVDDPRIVYTFHFYDHTLFTHQKAGWNKISVDYEKFRGDFRVDYPGEIPKLAEFAQEMPQYKDQQRWAGKRFDAAWMREAIQPAVDFLKATGKPLYCGEYGVIRHAPPKSAEQWVTDFSNLMREHKIGRALWNYKDPAFPSVDMATGKPINPGVVRAASQKW